MRLFKKQKETNLATKNSLIEKIGNRIYFGPFSGIKIPKKTYDYLTISEILGLYESCLHSKFTNLLNKEINNVILVGGNNGYYAAGINYLFNPKTINIYETEVRFHSIINSWLLNNKLSKTIILGKATIEEFERIETKIDFVFMDCEGYEIELLNPQLFLWQQKTEILLELHPFYVDNLIAVLTSRFKKTHKIEIIYDDFNEDVKIDKILNGLDLDIKYSKHPTHRWIKENNEKVYTSGIFMFLTQK
ncbi:MAG: FkbM family methyltransferase [Lutibacter sp.]